MIVDFQSTAFKSLGLQPVLYGKYRRIISFCLPNPVEAAALERKSFFRKRALILFPSTF